MPALDKKGTEITIGSRVMVTIGEPPVRRSVVVLSVDEDDDTWYVTVEGDEVVVSTACLVQRVASFISSSSGMPSHTSAPGNNDSSTPENLSSNHPSTISYDIHWAIASFGGRIRTIFGTISRDIATSFVYPELFGVCSALFGVQPYSNDPYSFKRQLNKRPVINELKPLLNLLLFPHKVNLNDFDAIENDLLALEQSSGWVKFDFTTFTQEFRRIVEQHQRNGPLDFKKIGRLGRALFASHMAKTKDRLDNALPRTFVKDNEPLMPALGAGELLLVLGMFLADHANPQDPDLNLVVPSAFLLLLATELLIVDDMELERDIKHVCESAGRSRYFFQKSVNPLPTLFSLVERHTPAVPRQVNKGAIEALQRLKEQSLREVKELESLVAMMEMDRDAVWNVRQKDITVVHDDQGKKHELVTSKNEEIIFHNQLKRKNRIEHTRITQAGSCIKCNGAYAHYGGSQGYTVKFPSFPIFEQKLKDTKYSNWVGDQVFCYHCFHNDVETAVRALISLPLDLSKAVYISDPLHTLKTSLLPMVGLFSAKKKLLEILDTMRRCHIEYIPSFHGHFVAQGNPGTGKTTVAELFAKVLEECGVFSKCTIKKYTGQELAQKGTAELKDIEVVVERNSLRYKEALRRERVASDNGLEGYVLFVDEAYQLTDTGAAAGGRAVYERLMDLMETGHHSLVVIFAGYPREMGEFLEKNSGFRSRVQHDVRFDDYSDAELLRIFADFVARTERNFDRKVEYLFEGGIEGPFTQVVIRRLGRLRGPRFGNARDVRKVWEDIRQEALKLSERGSMKIFTDPSTLRCFEFHNPGSINSVECLRTEYHICSKALLRGDATADLEDLEAWQKLSKMDGLEKVKGRVRQLHNQARNNLGLELEGKDPIPVTLNGVFIGPPGTGKTTVAKLLAQLMKSLGLLSRGHEVYVTGKDLLGDHIGESKRKTAQRLDEARGGVLICDEFYTLYTHRLGKTESLDTFVEMISGDGPDDRAVFVLGYENEIKEVLDNTNPGLSSRLNFANPWVFESMELDSCMNFLEAMAREKDIRWLGPQGAGKVRAGVSRLRMSHSFASVRTLKTLFNEAHARAIAANRRIFVDEDFFPPRVSTANHIVSPNMELKVMQLSALFRQNTERRLPPLDGISRGYLFTGNPGTGKTIGARAFASLLSDAGILPSDKVIETSATRLMQGYVGQTGQEVLKKVREAVGGVLFIDEAQDFMPSRDGRNTFGSDALNAIKDAMTSDVAGGVFFCVLAGYDARIHKMLDYDPGLKSRFSDKIEFPSLTPQEALEWLLDETRKLGVQVNENYKLAMLKLLDAITRSPEFGNYRDLKNILDSYKRAALMFDSEDLANIWRRSHPTDQSLPSPQGLLLECMKDLHKDRVRRTVSSPVADVVHAQATVVMADSQAPVSSPVVSSVQLSETTETGPEDQGDGGSAHDAALADLIKSYEAGLLLEKDPAVDAAKWHEMQEALRSEITRLKALKSAKEKARTVKRAEAIRKRMTAMMLCPMGFTWFPTHNGFRCGGGSHFCDYKQIRQYVMEIDAEIDNDESLK